VKAAEAAAAQRAQAEAQRQALLARKVEVLPKPADCKWTAMWEENYKLFYYVNQETKVVCALALREEQRRRRHMFRFL